MFRGTNGGREFWKALDGCIGESWQHGGEIFTDGDVDISVGKDLRIERQAPEQLTPQLTDDSTRSI